MDKIISTLTIILMAILEVSVTLVEYALYTVYLMYMAIRSKKNFRKAFVKLSKKVVDDIVGTFKNGKEVLARV